MAVNNFLMLLRKKSATQRYIVKNLLPAISSTKATDKSTSDLLKEADKYREEYLAESPFGTSRTDAPDASSLMDISSEERRLLLEGLAKEDEPPTDTPMDSGRDQYITSVNKLMQPSQEFQQQMKGREVALRRASGDGLGALNAMQDENYVLGSGSALRQKPQPIAPEWTKMNRAARRLRRQGYEQQAGQMASLAEVERLNTPTIDTQEQRNRMNFMDMERDVKSEEQRRQGDIYDMYLRRRFQQGLNSMG